MRFEIYQDYSWSQDEVGPVKLYNDWYWRLRAANGRIIADGSEGYASKSGVRKALRRLMKPSNFINIEIVEVES